MSMPLNRSYRRVVVLLRWSIGLVVFLCFCRSSDSIDSSGNENRQQLLEPPGEPFPSDGRQYLRSMHSQEAEDGDHRTFRTPLKDSRVAPGVHRLWRPENAQSAEHFIRKTRKQMMQLRNFRAGLKREEQLEKRLHEERIKHVIRVVQQEEARKEQVRKRQERQRPIAKKAATRAPAKQEITPKKKEIVLDLEKLLPKRKPPPPRPLCGCVNVMQGSPLVQTSCDLRDRISLGEGIRIRNDTSAIVLPRDQRTITLNRPYTGRTEKCVKAYRANLTDDAAESIATGQCHPLTGKVVVRYGSNILEADHDLRQEIFDGEALRIGQEEFTVLKRPGAHKMVLSRPFPLRRRSNGTMRREQVHSACRKINLWRANMDPVGCGVVSTKNTGELMAKHDFSKDLKKGDIVRIRTETFQISEPVTPTRLSVTPISHLPSRSDLCIYRENRCTPVPGYVSVSHGSNRIRSTHDLRSILGVGDTVKLGANEYEVTRPVELDGFFVHEPWEENDAAGLRLQRCVVSDLGGGGKRASCGVEVKTSSTHYRTLCDLGKEVAPGNSVLVCGQPFFVIPPAETGDLVFDQPWNLPNGVCNLYVQDTTPLQSAVESIAFEKMKCETLHCFAKMEEKEAGIKFAMRPATNVGAEPKTKPVNRTRPSKKEEEIRKLKEKIEHARIRSKELTIKAQITVEPEDIAKAENATEEEQELVAKGQEIGLYANVSRSDKVVRDEGDEKRLALRKDLDAINGSDTGSPEAQQRAVRLGLPIPQSTPQPAATDNGTIPDPATSTVAPVLSPSPTVSPAEDDPVPDKSTEEAEKEDAQQEEEKERKEALGLKTPIKRSTIPEDLKPEKIPDYTIDDIDTSAGQNSRHEKGAVPVNVGGGELRGRSQGETVKTPHNKDTGTNSPPEARDQGFVWWKTRV